MLYFVVMAGAGSAETKGKELTEEQKKAKRDSDRARAKTSMQYVYLFQPRHITVINLT